MEDLGTSMLELSKALERPWPGGSKQAYERFLEWAAKPKSKTSLTPTEARAQFEAIG